VDVTAPTEALAAGDESTVVDGPATRCPASCRQIAPTIAAPTTTATTHAKPGIKPAVATVVVRVGGTISTDFNLTDATSSSIARRI